MVRTRILLLSVLKPVDDTRTYEKIGTALAKIDNAEVHIAGFKPNKIPKIGNIEFHPLFDFERLSTKRLLTSWKIWNLLLKVKPEVAIPNTHELLIVTILYKIIFGCRIIYDVQENYFRNLWYGNQFPFIIKYLLAIYVRLKEWILSPFIETFLLAERCYVQEMRFMGRKAVILENKFKKPQTFRIPDKRTKAPLKLLYTGTIANLYGIFEAVKLARDLLDLRKGTFSIIGYCPDNQVLSGLIKKISDDHRITLIGGEKLVSHDDILQHISESNLGLVAYKNNPSLSNKIPTRIYEYLACQLPFIIPDNPLWTNLATKYNAGIAINYASYSAEQVLDIYDKTLFYNPSPGTEIYFDREESVLQAIITR